MLSHDETERTEGRAELPEASEGLFGAFAEYLVDLRGSQLRDKAEWSAVESNAKSEWEAHNPNTWERFKMAVRHAWEKATKKQS